MKKNCKFTSGYVVAHGAKNQWSDFRPEGKDSAEHSKVIFCCWIIFYYSVE